MEVLYDIAGTSRQAFHQWMQPSDYQQNKTQQSAVIAMAHDIRKRFLPGSSARAVYTFIRHKHPHYNDLLRGWGKHAFEHLCLHNGLRIEHRRFVPKTTQRGDYVFDNLIEGLAINDINMIWVSDICYIFSSGGQLIGYATTVMDVYSRRLLGLAFSQTMHAAVTSQVVIRQALKVRASYNLDHLIFHSDAGKQYIEKGFLALLASRNIRSSMAESCYENAFAESLNDIIKNHLLPEWDLNSFQELKKNEKFIMNCYNINRSHGSLNRMTPVEFELSLANLPPCQRTFVNIQTKSTSI
jgi:putative transposase